MIGFPNLATKDALIKYQYFFNIMLGKKTVTIFQHIAPNTASRRDTHTVGTSPTNPRFQKNYWSLSRDSRGIAAGHGRIRKKYVTDKKTCPNPYGQNILFLWFSNVFHMYVRIRFLTPIPWLFRWETLPFSPCNWQKKTPGVWCKIAVRVTKDPPSPGSWSRTSKSWAVGSQRMAWGLGWMAPKFLQFYISHKYLWVQRVISPKFHQIPIYFHVVRINVTTGMFFPLPVSPKFRDTPIWKIIYCKPMIR